jgi:hypothetical protein
LAAFLPQYFNPTEISSPTQQSIRKVCRNEKITAKRPDSVPLRIHETVAKTRSGKGFDFFCRPRFSLPSGTATFVKPSTYFEGNLHCPAPPKRRCIPAANGIGTAPTAYSGLSTIPKYGAGEAVSLFGVENFGFRSVVTKTETTRDFTLPSFTTTAGIVGDICIVHRIAET